MAHVHQRDREPFLRALANMFPDRDEIGDGELGRAMRELLAGGFFKPPTPSRPDLLRPGRPSKLKAGAAIA